MQKLGVLFLNLAKNITVSFIVPVFLNPESSAKNNWSHANELVV